jgi:thymidine kinase
MFLENTVNHKNNLVGSKLSVALCFRAKQRNWFEIKRAQFAKQKVEIFKPAIDTRYNEEMVVSHDANEIRSTPVPAAANIFSTRLWCCRIDEAQFFDDEDC